MEGRRWCSVSESTLGQGLGNAKDLGSTATLPTLTSSPQETEALGRASATSSWNRGCALDRDGGAGEGKGEGALPRARDYFWLRSPGCSPPVARAHTHSHTHTDTRAHTYAHIFSFALSSSFVYFLIHIFI